MQVQVVRRSLEAGLVKGDTYTVVNSYTRANGRHKWYILEDKDGKRFEAPAHFFNQL